MRFFLMALFLCLAGCQFASGFKDEIMRQLPGVAADAVEAKLGDDFKELKDGLRDFGGKLPPPSSPVDNGVGYTLGGLLAYIVGSLGKGMVRAKMTGKKDHA